MEDPRHTSGTEDGHKLAILFSNVKGLLSRAGVCVCVCERVRESISAVAYIVVRLKSGPFLFISPLFNQVGKLRTSSHLQL